jgi:hypothetical protein
LTKEPKTYIGEKASGAGKLVIYMQKTKTRPYTKSIFDPIQKSTLNESDLNVRPGILTLL